MRARAYMHKETRAPFPVTFFPDSNAFVRSCLLLAFEEEEEEEEEEEAFALAALIVVASFFPSFSSSLFDEDEAAFVALRSAARGRSCRCCRCRNAPPRKVFEDEDDDDDEADFELETLLIRAAAAAAVGKSVAAALILFCSDLSLSRASCARFSFSRAFDVRTPRARARVFFGFIQNDGL